MKEPEFDASSLESPDVEPIGDQSDPTELPDAEQEEGSTLEVPENEEFYIRQGSLTRRPKYGVFGVLGGLIGLIVGFVLAQIGSIPAGQNYTRTDLAIVLVGLGVPAGVLLALFMALVLDRRKK